MKLLLYSTKAKPYLYKSLINNKYFVGNDIYLKGSELNGKIVAECDFEVEEIELKMEYMGLYYCGETVNGWSGNLCEGSQLDNWQLLDYLGDKIGNKGYAIHIKNLHIFDKPRELRDYVIKDGKINDTQFFKVLEKAPQNMMYAYEYIDKWELSASNMFTLNSFLEKNILISIRPEWLCKILNGEKTIEVRKKVLKGMLKNE